MRMLLAALLALLDAGQLPPAGGTAAPITGVVHEPAPSAETPVAAVRVEAVGGEREGQVVVTDAEGRFTLARPMAAKVVLLFTRAGYETARIELPPSADGPMRVALKPEPASVPLTRSGDNACKDLPAPPPGVPGLREYARIPIHHDGYLTVKAAQLPFTGNQGYVYRQTADGWVANEADYVLIRTPLPVRGGFVYVLTFGGDKDLCAAWSLDAVHPR